MLLPKHLGQSQSEMEINGKELNHLCVTFTDYHVHQLTHCVYHLLYFNIILLNITLPKFYI